MLIKKEYKAYMAHRNQELEGSCKRIHGHDYKIFCYFEVERNGSITTLFDDFDKIIEPMLKNEYDHRMILDKNDSLRFTFDQHLIYHGEDLGYKLLDYPTSVENLCFHLFDRIRREHNLPIVQLDIQETRTSTILYTLEDYVMDKVHFNIR